MARGGVRGRGNRRRGGMRTAARAVKRAMRAPRENIRPRKSIRTRAGHGVISWNTLRRLTIFPRKVGKDGADTTQWWLSTLKWVGSIALQLITVLLGSEGFEQHKVLYASESQKRYTAGSAVVGSIQSLILGAEDLVASSPLTTLTKNGKVFLCKFHQGRIMHLRVTLIPGAPISKRGGTLAMALLPLTLGENLDFAKSTDESEKWTFDDVCRLPRAVVQSSSSPISVVYSPRIGELAYDWMDVGFPSGQGSTKVGGQKSLRLVVAYMDVSSNSADVSEEYALTEASFELVFDGRVELREISDDRELPTVPFSNRNVGQHLVCDYADKYFATDMDGEWVRGIFYHNPPVKTEPPSPSEFSTFSMDA